MTDNTELKRLVDRVLKDRRFCGDENHKALADGVLALIAENKRLAANVKFNLCDYPAIHQGDVDLLVAFVRGASQIELAKVHNCTPPNISRKIRRVKERLGWREGMLVPEIRDRAEHLRALASQGAVMTADLMAERDRLRAEVAGLRTGYEAYERVNAELKAESEALRKDAELHAQIQRAAGELPVGWEVRVCVEHESGYVELWDQDGCEVDFPNSCESLALTVSDAIDAALGQGERS